MKLLNTKLIIKKLKLRYSCFTRVGVDSHGIKVQKFLKSVPVLTKGTNSSLNLGRRVYQTAFSLCSSNHKVYLFKSIHYLYFTVLAQLGVKIYRFLKWSLNQHLFRLIGILTRCNNHNFRVLCFITVLLITRSFRKLFYTLFRLPQKVELCLIRNVQDALFDFFILRRMKLSLITGFGIKVRSVASSSFYNTRVLITCNTCRSMLWYQVHKCVYNNLLGFTYILNYILQSIKPKSTVLYNSLPNCFVPSSSSLAAIYFNKKMISFNNILSLTTSQIVNLFLSTQSKANFFLYLDLYSNQISTYYPRNSVAYNPLLNYILLTVNTLQVNLYGFRSLSFYNFFKLISKYRGSSLGSWILSNRHGALFNNWYHVYKLDEDSPTYSVLWLLNRTLWYDNLFFNSRVKNMNIPFAFFKEIVKNRVFGFSALRTASLFHFISFSNLYYVHVDEHVLVRPDLDYTDAIFFTKGKPRSILKFTVRCFPRQLHLI